ncbi:transcriptional regulator [Cupriavidus gilardii CR3]|nr:transcriptional regulator [Cupriavidus gilardii CR3]KAB0599379.1 helix-turn-helix domain-containing protein [Cupriavidus gilardii]
MRSLPDIAALLRNRMKALSLTQSDLGAKTGLARKTVNSMLSGQGDYKVTTLLAVLDRLGYELAIVPKGAAAGLGQEGSFTPTAPVVKTRVQAARERLAARKTEADKS